MARTPSGFPSGSQSPLKGRRAGHTKSQTKAELLKTLEKYDKAAVAVKRGDDWANVLTGLGITGKDWRKYNVLQSDAALQQQTIDDLYAGDNLAAKIVDNLPEHAIRRWVRIVGGDGQEASDFQKEVFVHLKRLRAKQRFLQWLKLGRKDGGALLLIGAGDGNSLEKPVEPEQLREIRHLHILERWAVVPDAMDEDPQSDNFGCPLFYKILPRSIEIGNAEGLVARPAETLEGKVIHYSRLFVHEGVQVSERKKVEQKGWGYSVLQRAYNPIETYRILWAHISTLFKHVAQTVVKIAGYQELQGADFQQAVQSRIAQIQLARSTLNVVPLDKEDEIEEQTLRGIAGALEILKYAQEDLAQAADMPITMLFGHMPAGFSNEDISGARNWYDKVRGTQEDLLQEPLTELIELIANAYGIAPPEEWHLEFYPLEEPNEVEAADVGLKRAQQDEIYIKNGAISSREVRETLRANPKAEYILEEGDLSPEDNMFQAGMNQEKELASANKALAPMAGKKPEAK